ncbi:MAG: hypothetical protein PHP59_11550 [Methanofollis sp.]|uniref:hypothetical protein n=1 Tax=Methanofollis sp. TaxID=2052835 RepID=UPI002612D882|nr:hypothetical protein [Methanofollis sp.]MDD4255995.1 hypothetical protein [Methanofollis sp.]
MIASTPLKGLLVGGKILRGAHTGKPTSESDPLYPVVGIRALAEDGTVDHDNVEHLAVRNETDIERSCIHAGDVLLSMRGQFRAALADKKCEGHILSQNLVILRFREEADAALMAEYFNSQQGRDALAALSRGTALPLLSIMSLETLEVPALGGAARKGLARCLAAYREYEALAHEEAELTAQIRDALVAEYLGVRQ